MSADRLLEGRAYTIKDVGCYVDGARGIHAIEKIIHLANAHGADLTVTLADDEFVGEMEDAADAFMNKNFAVEGAYWGRNENGDWGLWSSEEALADQKRVYDGEDAEEWQRKADQENTYQENR